MTDLEHQPLRLILIGFMGCGKTTVGRIVAEQLRWRFADLDEFIALRTSQSVPEILASAGEPAFRRLEHNVLEELLLQEQIVISLGGGAPETAAVRSLLSSSASTLVLHLHAPFPVLYARCAAQALVPGSTARPLLGAPPQAEARYHRRQPLYRETAHDTVDVALCSPHDVASRILQRLRS